MKKNISAIHVQIGANIRVFRKEHGLTLADLSKLCCIEVDQMKRMERGEVDFRFTTLVKLLLIMDTAVFDKIEKRSI